MSIWPEPKLTSEQVARLKREDRAKLSALAPDEAQAEVEAILNPRLWHVADRKQLAWPGDWADDEKGG
jgi:hypothetical protein